MNKALKMNEIVLVKYLFKEEWSPLEDVVNKNAGQFGEVFDVSGEKELLSVIEASPATLVIASVSGKDELGLVINFLKNQRRVLKESNVKFSVVNFINNKQVETALMKMGCQEVMEPTMRDKALKFKIDFWKKSLSVGQKKDAEAKVTTLKDRQGDGSDKAKQEVSPITWVDALKSVDDMWLIKSPQDVKKILSRWMVKVMGPSPFVAQWTEIPGQRGVWKFSFKEGIRDTFHSADGDWIFKGDQKPEFVWKENLWMISGTSFQLVYQDEGEVLSRFRASPQAVEVCKNSSYALSRERAIIESFDQEILVKKGLKVDDSKTEIEKDKKGEGLLTQDISGQEAQSTKYKGAVALELADAPEEAKKHKVDPSTAKRLTGKSATENLGEGFYDGVVEAQELGKAANGKHQSAADRLGDTDGDAGTEDVGLSKYKGKLEHAHSDRKSNYGGESETDDLGPDKWSNQKDAAPEKAPREARERAERESSGTANERAPREEAQARSLKEKAQGGQYGGEAETDDLGSSHYSNKHRGQSDEAAPREASERNAFERARKAREEAESAAGEPHLKKERPPREAAERGDFKEKPASGLQGKSSTDDLGEDHYSGADDKKKLRPAAVEKERAHLAELGETKPERPEKKQRDEVEALAKRQAKVGTDDLGANHYSGKTKQPQGEEETEEEEESPYLAKKKRIEAARAAYQEESEDDLRGRGRADDLGGSHYKGKTGKAARPDETEEDDELDESGAVAKKAAHARAAGPASAKKIRAVDDLLPDGDGEDPAADILPSDFEEAGRVDVPMERGGPRLVVNNNDRPERVKPEPRSEAEKLRAKAVPAARSETDGLDEEVLGDDGKPVTNDQVKVKAVLTCKSLGPAEHIVHVDDFFDTTMIVKMKQKSPAVNETVNVTISFDYQNRKKQVSVVGKCLETDRDDEGDIYATIELEPSDLKIFEQFMTLYRLRQQHIHQFLKAAKGL